MWNGTTIGTQYQTLADIADAVRALEAPTGWPEMPGFEWLVKAGEGGSWQSTWDPHPLAISGVSQLETLITLGEELQVQVIPYVVLRGRADWLPNEVAMIQGCARVARRVVINLEPGASYFNGTPSVAWVEDFFRELAVDPSKIELCAIPRTMAAAYLGGPAVMSAWLSHVGRASWECYDASAADLSPEVAIPLVTSWGATSPEHQVLVVQRSRIDAWSGSPLASGGLEVWNLDSD